MDDLSSIPPTDAPLTPSEKGTLSRLFGNPSSEETKTHSPPSWGTTLRLAVVLTLVFLVLANPVSSAIIGLIPGVSPGMIEWLTSGLLFFFIVIFVTR